MKNLPEFKALIERYESITLDDIPTPLERYTTANRLTGFGSKKSCSLCKPLLEFSESIISVTDCDNCVYGEGYDYNVNYCVENENAKTHDKIVYAKTPEQLLKAFKLRAKHMRKILKTKGL